jgi:hypothetical protein
MSSKYLFNGIHSSAQNAWIIAVTNNCHTIKATQNMCDRLRILQELATTIHGVSDATIFKTLAEFEQEHY